MKKGNAIVVFMTIIFNLIFSACNQKDAALQELRDLTTNLCDSSEYYTEEEWQQAKNQYHKLIKEIGKYEVSIDDYEEMSCDRDICQTLIIQHDLKTSTERKIVYQKSEKGFVNIYEKPDMKSRIIGRLINNGSDYLGVDKSKQWYKIQLYNHKGFVPKQETIIFCGNPVDTRLVYYVVLGGWHHLNTAISEGAQYPKEYISPIFSAINSKKEHVYRICCYSTYNEEEADSVAAQIRMCDTEKDGLKSAYVWKCIGQAKCVFQPIGLDEKPVLVYPK